MTSTQYCLSSKTYKSRVFEGFCRLQRNEEFTDMTLVAEGCLVKVHRTLMALSSPLLKELLRTVPCKHPVLFLNDIPHNILCFILEYVYTGEVNIPNEHIKPFFKAAKSMHITGLEKIVIPETKDVPIEKDDMKDMISNLRLSSAAKKPNVIIHDIQKVQLPIVNDQGKIFPTYTSELPSIPSAAKDNIRINKIDNDLMIQQTNENNTLPISSSVPVSDKIDQYLNLISVKIEPETDINLHDNEDFNNIQVVRDIKNENIHTLPTMIEGDQGYINNHNLVNQPNENADGASQVDLSTLMNISNTSLVQSHDMAAVDISINDLVEIKLLDTLNTITATETVANKNRAVKKMKYDHEQSKNIGKEILEENDIDMASTADLHEDDNEKDELDSENAGSAPSSAYVTKERMDQVKQKDSDSIIYMVSYRGSLQLILNHYIYNCQYSRNTNSMRRWRCVDYKRLKCLAMVDTHNSEIVNRKHTHSHPNHDEKIYYKVMKRQCFPTIEMAQESVKRKTSSQPNVIDTIDLDEEL